MSKAPKILKGITWGHSRGILPLQACSQRIKELYPDVEIQWKQRTLQEFADYPIEKLTEHYDLLIIDHPWVGCAADNKCVLPLDQYLSADFMQNQQDHQVGGSHDSYNYKGHQWALAIDAATPVASYRADLLEQYETPVPTTWEDVLQLAKKGKVAAPSIPIDLLMNFYMFSQIHGEKPFTDTDKVVSDSTGELALESMKEFYSLLDEELFTANPIKVAELMSRTNRFWYCPFAYGYSNYSREGYAQYPLRYANIVSYNDVPMRSTLGGTGLAISSFSSYKEEAVRFAEMLASENYQRTEYVMHGGQPGHRKAWLDPRNNILTADFFQSTIATLDNAYLRPRYHGYLDFQDEAGDYVHDYLLGKISKVKSLEKINTAYRNSKKLIYGN